MISLLSDYVFIHEMIDNDYYESLHVQTPPAVLNLDANHSTGTKTIEIFRPKENTAVTTVHLSLFLTGFLHPQS